ncbi:hypothetical protein Bbelb_300470 [Branchiostoma belcheri]|nr:hypothetical protein Bbelb_300470 [Branchiostoma belcheri]
MPRANLKDACADLGSYAAAFIYQRRRRHRKGIAGHQTTAGYANTALSNYHPSARSILRNDHLWTHDDESITQDKPFIPQRNKTAHSQNPQTATQHELHTPAAPARFSTFIEAQKLRSRHWFNGGIDSQSETNPRDHRCVGASLDGNPDGCEVTAPEAITTTAGNFTEIFRFVKSSVYVSRSCVSPKIARPGPGVEMGPQHHADMRLGRVPYDSNRPRRTPDNHSRSCFRPTPNHGCSKVFGRPRSATWGQGLDVTAGPYRPGLRPAASPGGHAYTACKPVHMKKSLVAVTNDVPIPAKAAASCGKPRLRDGKSKTVFPASPSFGTDTPISPAMLAFHRRATQNKGSDGCSPIQAHQHENTRHDNGPPRRRHVRSHGRPPRCHRACSPAWLVPGIGADRKSHPLSVRQDFVEGRVSIGMSQKQSAVAIPDFRVATGKIEVTFHFGEKDNSRREKKEHRHRRPWRKREVYRDSDRKKGSIALIAKHLLIDCSFPTTPPSPCTLHAYLPALVVLPAATAKVSSYECVHQAENHITGRGLCGGSAAEPAIITRLRHLVRPGSGITLTHGFKGRSDGSGDSRTQPPEMKPTLADPGPAHFRLRIQLGSPQRNPNVSHSTDLSTPHDVFVSTHGETLPTTHPHTGRCRVMPSRHFREKMSPASKTYFDAFLMEFRRAYKLVELFRYRFRIAISRGGDVWEAAAVDTLQRRLDPLPLLLTEMGDPKSSGLLLPALHHREGTTIRAVDTIGAARVSHTQSADDENQVVPLDTNETVEGASLIEELPAGNARDFWAVWTHRRWQRDGSTRGKSISQ